jgi:serine/threonine protein kinase
LIRKPSEPSDTVDTADDTLVGSAVDRDRQPAASSDATREVHALTTAERTRTAGDGDATGPMPIGEAAAAQLLNGRYELGQRIASGGMAAVWRGRDRILDRVVAVKVLHPHLTVDADFRERFRREAISAAKLSHPNIVGLYDTGTDGDSVFLVMEFVEGSTLRDVVARGGTLTAGHAAAIGERVARALDSAHR